MVHFDYLTLDKTLALSNPVPDEEADRVAKPIRKAWQAIDINLNATYFMGEPLTALEVIAWGHNEQQYADIWR